MTILRLNISLLKSSISKNGQFKSTRCFIPGLPVLCCFLLILLLGCSRKVADVALPYESPQTFSLPGEEVAPDRWWQVLNYPTLNILVDSALESNLPLKIFWYQFEESKAILTITSSARVPDVFLQLRSGISRPEPDFAGGENTQLGLGASYEADLWGRIRYSIAAEEYRFRPIILTTLTTFGGLTPIILETSRQAFQLIPMAISLGFGIVFATSIILVIVPCLYMIMDDVVKVMKKEKDSKKLQKT